MSDPALIRFDLPLEESDIHYFHARTARDSHQQPNHDERSVLYCLLGIGHIRLRQNDDAERRLLFAKQLDKSFADPPLLLASLAALASGDTSKYLDAALAAQPDCLERTQVHELLWLLGVPRKRRETVATKEPITRHNVEILAWAIECQDDKELNEARELLVKARTNLGF